MKKTIKNNKRILIILGVIIILLAAWFIFNAYNRTQDKARFQQAEEVKAQVASELVAYLGDNVTSVSEKNECFNTEQGPFDNGRLWCQASTIIQLNDNIEFISVGSVFLKSDHDLIKESQYGGEGDWLNYTITLHNGIGCNLATITEDGKYTGSARRNVLYGKSNASVSVACSDRAKAKHYPYSE